MATVWICTCLNCQPNLLFQGITDEPAACPECESANIITRSEVV